MSHQQRFASELAATADALRHLHGQVEFLFTAGDTRVTNFPDCWVVMAHAKRVAQALEALAQRLAAQEV